MSPAAGKGSRWTTDDGKFIVGSMAYGSNNDGAIAPGGLSGGSEPSSLSGNLNDSRLSSDRSATPETTSFNGVAVTAINQDHLEVIGGSGGASGAVSVNLSGAVDVLNNTTTAFVGSGAHVNTANNNSGAANNQAVLVAAGDDFAYLGIAAGVSIAGSTSVTPNANVLVATHNTKAFIDSGAVVNAAQNVTVRARAEEDILLVTAGASLAGDVAARAPSR